MIDKIVSNYAPKLSSFTSVAKNVCCNQSAISKYKEAIKQYLDIVDSRQTVSDAFISAFSSNPEIFANMQAGNTTFNTANDYSYEISTDSYEILMSMFENDGLSNILTFTDSSGNPYSFIKKDGVIVDNYQCFISSQTHPTSIKDCILYADSKGKYYFNPLIRIAEYYDGEVAASVTVNTIKESIDTICSIANVYGGNDILSQLTALESRYPYYDGENDTINYRIQSFISYIGLSPTGVVSDIITMFHDIVLAMLEDSSRRRIKTSSVYGLVSDLVINNELIDVIRTTYDNIVNGDTSQLVTCIRTFIDNKSQVIKSFGNSILLGFSKSGVVGALSAIVDLLKQVFSSQPSEYSVFDTKGSVPQAFSAGFVAIITGIATNLFQIISGCMHPVVAIIGTIGYGIFSTIGNVINANVSEEYARVDDLNECENIAPYAIYGHKLSISSASSLLNLSVINDDKQLVSLKSVLDWSTTNGNPLVTINWYGVIIKIAYADPVINDSGVVSATYVVINVFPTVCNTEDDIFDDATENQIRSAMSHPYAVSLNTLGTGSLDYRNWTAFTGQVLNIVANRVYSARRDMLIDFTPKVVNDDSGQYAGYVHQQDAYCHRQVFKNILLFWGLMYTIGYNVSNNYSSGNTTVTVSLIDGVPSISMSGVCVPFIEIVFGAVAHGNSTLGTYDGHTIWTRDNSASFESLGKACVTMQNVTSTTVIYNMIRSLFSERSTLQYYSTSSNRPSISFRSSYKDIPYFIAPKYTRGSVITSIVIGALIVATTIAAVAITTIAVKRKIQKQQALHQAKVEAAWSDLTNDPSPENYSKYRKTVKANNRFSRVFGGTKYDYVNYWNGDTSERDSVLSSYETITNHFDNEASTTTDLPVNSISSIIRLLNGEVIS